jgi:hypothetical protein
VSPLQACTDVDLHNAPSDEHDGGGEGGLGGGDGVGEGGGNGGGEGGIAQELRQWSPVCEPQPVLGLLPEESTHQYPADVNVPSGEYSHFGWANEHVQIRVLQFGPNKEPQPWMGEAPFESTQYLPALQ